MVNGIASLYSQNGLLDFLEEAKETKKPKEEIPVQNLEKTDKFEKGKEEVEAPYQKGNHSSCQNGHDPSKCAGLGGSGQCGCENSLKTNHEKDKTQEAEEKEETKKAESKDKLEGNEELKVGKGGCDCTVTLRDVSDDSTVSFQTPTEIPVDQTEAKVRAHEQEHVTHETGKAQREGKEISTSVQIKYTSCPECGKRYAVGGVTTVRTREKPDSQAKAEGELNEAAALAEVKGLSPELEQEILNQKQQRPDMTPEELARWLKQQEGIELSRKEIEEILEKNNQDEVKNIPPELKQKVLQKIRQNPQMDEEELKKWLKQQEDLEIPKEELKNILDQNSESFNPTSTLASKFNPSISVGQSLDLVA